LGIANRLLALRTHKLFAYLLSAVVIAMTVTLVGMDVIFNYWYNYFYNSLQAYDKQRRYLSFNYVYVFSRLFSSSSRFIVIMFLNILAYAGANG
jgi:ABC-type uncharacterized transport system fused permease/ATPase subunit